MRNNGLDVIKGFAIFLVVIGHIIQNSIVDYDHNILWRFIYSFHMPLFFFISGFFAYLSKNEGCKLIINRFNTLIIPFFIWAIIYYLIRDETSIGLIRYLLKVVITPDFGLWFLWVLFFCYLLLSIAKKINANLYLIIVLIALSMIFVSILIKDKIFGLNLISKQFPFFILGFYTNNFNKFVNKKIIKYKFPIIFFFILGMIFWMRKEDPLFYKYINLGPFFKLLYLYLVGILGVISFFSFSIGLKEYSKNKLLIALSFIGKHTLAIYSIHFLLLDFIDFKYGLKDFYYLNVIIFSIAVIVFCLLIEKVISINSIASKLFFGK